MKKPDSDTDTKLVIKQQYDSMVTKTVGEFNTSTTDEWEHGAATVSLYVFLSLDKLIKGSPVLAMQHSN